MLVLLKLHKSTFQSQINEILKSQIKFLQFFWIILLLQKKTLTRKL